MLLSFIYFKENSNIEEIFPSPLCSGREDTPPIPPKRITFPSKYILKGITAKNCFGCKEVLELELVGDKVIKTLLDTFVPAILYSTPEEIKDTRTYAGKLYKIISPNFKYIACHDYEKKCHREFEDISVYDKIHLVVDYVSGMTDSYAVNLYKKLLGIELP